VEGRFASDREYFCGGDSMSKDVYFTSDTHFFHENIIKYCDRPFESMEEMNDTIKKRWNNQVDRHDTVWHLGDVSVPWKAKNYLEIVEELNGSIRLVKGNHDQQYDDMEMEHLFYEIYEPPVEREFDVVVDDEEQTVDIPMLHDPHNAPLGRFSLVGHVHDNWKFHPNALNVGVDVFNFEPIHEDQVVRYYEDNVGMREYSLDNFDYYDHRVYIDELEDRIDELESKLESA
jgi:calcineurin-like phosphoesterase family protein